jgi:transcription elongation factor GreB
VSKAFTKEVDTADEDGDEIPVPAGKNYMTPHSFATIKQEYDHLFSVERPKIVDVVSWAASNGDRSENADYQYGKRRLREIDRRMRYLGKRMASAVIVNPAEQPDTSRVYFGATVTYVDAQDRERTVTIVGEDEANLEQGKVSWISPIARALLKTQVGDSATVQTPAGAQEIDILAISYPPA